MSRMSNLGGKGAFTLVEMLVVIAIISMVATASVTSIKSAQRQARTAKCQANMHALYNAAAAYHADKEKWPAAGAYEVYDSRYDNYSQFRGWVNWVLGGTSRSRPGDSGNLYRNGTSNSDGTQKDTHAASYYYVGTGANEDKDLGSSKINETRVYRSIDEGSIFRYTDKNFSIYCCDEFKSHYSKKSMRSYAMNQLYGCSRNPRNPLCRDAPSDDADRLAMFVEIGNLNKKFSQLGTKVGTTKGSAAAYSPANEKKPPTDTYVDDSVWDWDSENGGGGDGSKGENIGFMHKKSGKIYGHVVFADGHIESLALPASKEEQKQRRSLGKGELLVK